ncbi:hypothetical protein N7467_004079 [Penicillium canescens]|nr:hypothetical protein N7467_004079 [Penicillium canescens]
MYFAVIVSVQASHFAHQSLHRRATGSPNCKTYTVQDGDTCASIGKSSGATWAQQLSWNSDINSECSNLGDLSGKNICISNPSGDYAIPVTSSTVLSGATSSQSIVTTTALFLNPELNQDCTNLQKDAYYCVTSDNFEKVSMTSVPSSVPTPDYTSGLKNSSSAAIPLAKDTRTDCYDYIWLDNTTSNPLADCWTLAITADTSEEDIILWNRSLEEKSSSSSSSIAVIPRAASTASSSAGASTSATLDSYNYPHFEPAHPIA